MADALEFMATLTTAARMLRTRLDQEFAPHGITAQQAGVLLHVAGGMFEVRQLRQVMGMDAAGMTRLLDRLVARDLLAREAGADDRRTVRVTLTPAGRALIPVIPPSFGRVAQLLQPIPPTELAIALACLADTIPLLDT